MIRLPRQFSRQTWLAAATLLLALAVVALPLHRAALAMIMGGEGNAPINDPGWPKGAAALFNHSARIAYWEGPPFGGGQWHAECRGNTAMFSAVLADFAKLEIKTKRLVIHDGAGRSFWLGTNQDKPVDSKMDWMFMVWQPKSWEHLRKMPADLNPTEGGPAENGPPSQIDVYTGGNIRWDDVVVPKGLVIDDQRMAAHGFTTADGTVLEGKVFDLATNAPLAAKVKLQLVEPQKTGGYHYSVAAETAADAKGHWLVKQAPKGWLRVVIEADGYVPRVLGYGQFDGEPIWKSYDGGLAKPAPVSGRITDDAGQPLADAEVRLSNVAAQGGGRYEALTEYSTKTDADGRFRVEPVPLGTASVWLHKPGYCRDGLGPNITTPKADVALSMRKSGRVVVKVDFKENPRPAGYIVEVAAEGGGGPGSWGGSANIDAKNQYTFENVPPGRYVFTGHPNPSGAKEHTDPITVEVKAGDSELVLTAKPPPPARVVPPERKPKPQTNDAF